MKKTIRTLSMVMMALAMALCFLFAGLTFVRADVLAEVDQSAIDTAAVYIGPLDNFDVNETGIKFTAKIKKTDYYGLTGGVDAIGNNEVHLGVEVSRANADGSYTILPNAHYTVDTAGTLQTYNVGGVELEDYFMYSFSVKYNLERIFGENFDANDATIAKNINFMYADELCIRPFYQVISEVDGAGPRVYGEYGASRSMVHVAMAEYADVNSTLSPEEKELFISKYVSGKEDKGEIEVYADGSTNIEYDKENADNNPVTYTTGISGKVVARADGRIDASALKDYAYNDTFQLFGYTADRRVYTYNATYKGVEGVEATKVYEDILYDVTSGKYFLNNTALENEEVVALFGLDNEKLSAEEINNLPLGESVNLKVVTNKGVYNAVNFKAYTMVFENTAESRELMVQTFYTADYKLDIPHEEQRHEITGVYALAENIYFDYNVYDQDGNVVEGKYNTKEAFYNPLTDHTVDEVRTYYDPNIFRATFDGRGYALNNVLRYSGSYQSMFGVAGDGAVIKNLAINDSYKVSNTAISQGKSYESLLFYKAESAEAKLTLENIYIYITYTSGQATGSLLYYDSSVINVFDMDNVLIVANSDYEGTKQNSAFVSYNKTLAAGSSANNVYIVTNSSRGNFYLTAADAANSSNYASYKLEKVDDAFDYTTTIEQKLAEFKAANHDYSGFDVEYWTIIDGIPSWNTINTVAKIKDSTLKVQKEISSITAGEKFIISVQENSEEIAVGEYQVAISGDVADVDGKFITIRNDAYGKGIITIGYKGNVLANFDITVDTRVAKDLNEEVLISALDGKFYNSPTLAGAEIEDVYYIDGEGNKVSVYADGKVTTTGFFATDADILAAAKAGTNTVDLFVATASAIHAIEAQVYSAVFENTTESREAFAKQFAYKANAIYGGYYVLAENITFDLNNVANESFKSANVGSTHFAGVLDGRGYTINNLILEAYSSGYIYGWLGYYADNGATVKNIAINNVLYCSYQGTEASTTKTSGITSVIFARPASADAVVTFENVYINRTVNTTTSYTERDGVLFYGGTSADVRTHNIKLDKVIIYNNLVGGMRSGILGGYSNLTMIAGTDAEVKDTYAITNSTIAGTGDVFGTDATGKIVKYATAQDFYNAENNYEGFSSDYWTIGNDGVPVWITCSTVATLTDNDGAGFDTERIGVTYTVAVVENGVELATGYEIANTGDAVVSIDGNTITTLANVNGTAVITVTYNEVVLATYNITVNTKPIATLSDGEKAIESISSEIAEEDYYVTATFGGEDCTNTITLVLDGDNIVTFDGNKITTKANVAGAATIIVKIGEVEIASYAVTVNTRAVVTLTDKTGKEITAIESFDKDDYFTVTANAGGVDVTNLVTLEVEGTVVTKEGNVINVVENTYGTATVKVFVDGEEVTSFEATVDTVPFVEKTFEVLLSALDGKFYFNGTELEGAEVTEVMYNETSIINEGTIDTTAIRADEDIRANVETPVTVKVVTSTGGKYLLTNVKLYTAVFENEHESRMAMVEMFSFYAVRGHSNGADSKQALNDGYYVLAENITFDHSNLPMSEEDALANDNPENLSQSQWYKQAPYELFGNASTVANASIFAGTFDGRGYSLNNVGLCAGPMLGVARDGAIVKNVAFNVIVRYKATVVNTTKVYFTECGAGTDAKIFGQIETATSSVTFENVYINDPTTLDNGTYGSLVFYNSPSDENGAASQGKLTMKNVIIENASGPVMSGTTDLFDTISEDVVIKDTYLITTKNVGRGSETSAANSRGETFVKYASYEAMADANNSYSTFDNAYWTVVNGVPVWNTCSTIVLFVGNQGTVEEINSVIADETYTTSVIVNGKATTEGVTYALEGDAVATVSSTGVITIASNENGTATLTVKLNGVDIASITIIVDTRMATIVNEEVLLSKANGKLWYNGAFQESDIDVASIETAVNTQFELNDVMLSDGNKYNFTNVKIYDGVYAQENRKEFMKLFNFTGELYGYYVLAENITFEDADGDFACHSKTDVFGGTLDGRGYTLNNIYMPTSNTYGVFGGIPGANTVIKNIGINRLFFGSNEGAWGSSNHSSLFFRDGAENTTVTMGNVYVYIHFTATSYPGRYFYNLIYGRNGNNLTTFNLSNVIIINEYDPDTAEGETDSVGNTSNSASLGYAEIPGTATNTYYITNGKNYNKHTYTGLVSYGTGADATLQPVIDKMIAANNDYTSFSSDYWTVAEGEIPVWNSLIVAAE